MSMPITAPEPRTCPGACRAIPRRQRGSSTHALRSDWSAPRRAPYDFLVQSATWKLGAVSITTLRKQFDKTYMAVSFDNAGRAVTLNFIVVNGPDGWVISDVESPHDSLRMYLAQHRN